MKPLDIEEHDRLWWIWYDLSLLSQAEDDFPMTDFFREQRKEATRMKWAIHAQNMGHPKMDRFQP